MSTAESEPNGSEGRETRVERELPGSVRVSEEVMSQRLGEEVVLLELESGTYFGLEGVGARAWDLLVENGDPDAVVACLLDEYDVTERRLRADLAELIHELGRAGLLSVEGHR